MKTLSEQVANEIKEELERLPKKYANSTFNSHHEGLAAIQEEFEELKDEVFTHDLNQAYHIEYTDSTHRRRMRTEAIQVAAMCVRFIQELT